MSDPIRVFIGCAADGSDCESQAVAEYSLRSAASRAIDLTWLKVSTGLNGPLGGFPTARWGTPFSGLRFAVPHLCGYQGRAIYADTDVIFKADIAELWEQPIPAGVTALVKDDGPKQRTCVMLLDCEAAGRSWPSFPALKQLADGKQMRIWLSERPHLTAQFEGLWNCVDLKEVEIHDPNVKVIHYSSIAHQPSTPYAVARMARTGRTHWYDGEIFPHWRPELIEYFEMLLTEASIAGYAPERYEPANPYKVSMRSYRGVRVKGFSA